MVLEKTLESPLDCKEIQPVHPKGDQPWVFTGRTEAETETPILWPCHAKSWLIGKDPDAGRDWGQEEKGTTEDEMAGWHLWLNGRVGVNSGSWWWTGRPGMLRFMGLQRVGHDWATELNWQHTAGPHQFSTMHTALDAQQPHLPHSAPLPAWCLHVCSLHLGLYFCFENRFIVPFL